MRPSTSSLVEPGSRFLDRSRSASRPSTRPRRQGDRRRRREVTVRPGPARMPRSSVPSSRRHSRKALEALVAAARSPSNAGSNPAGSAGSRHGVLRQRAELWARQAASRRQTGPTEAHRRRRIPDRGALVEVASGRAGGTWAELDARPRAYAPRDRSPVPRRHPARGDRLDYAPTGGGRWTIHAVRHRQDRRGSRPTQPGVPHSTISYASTSPARSC